MLACQLGHALGDQKLVSLGGSLAHGPLLEQVDDALVRLSVGIEDVEDFVIDSLSDIAGSVLVLVGTLAFLLYQSWQVAVLAAVLVPVLSVISNHFS